MRSPELVLGSLRRSLFPPIDWRKLRFRGGWTGLPIYLVMILIYPASLAQAGWVDLNTQFTYIALAGAVLGTIAGNGRIRARRSTVLGALSGTLTVVVMTIIASDGPTVHAKAVQLATHVNNWTTQIFAGESANDPTVFVLLLGATCWAGAYAGAFALAREHRPWDAVVFSGICLTVNVSLALTSLYFDLILFTLLALVLLVRLHIVNLAERWERQNIVPAGEMDWRLLRGGLTWTLVLILMAFFTPRVAAADLVSNAFTTFDAPYQRLQAEWQRFFAGVSGPSRLQGVSFSDAIRLGQAPNLGDRIVFHVDAPAAHFWRAVTYDFYTGVGWRTTETDRVDKVTPQTLGREPMQATFDIIVPHANLLFGANEPQKVSVPFQFQTGDDRAYSTSVRAVNRNQAQGTYTTTSLVSTASKDELRRATTVYPAVIKAKYLQLPSSIPQRVKDLAFAIAATKATAYDKAEAIEAYLRNTYKYSTVVKSAPPGRDPVDYFLFDLKADFCEYFASSMTVLLREVGVPARVVEGFTAGEVDASGRYAVRELNAHAWVEAYFPQYGWIEFEPTPSELPFDRAETSPTDPNNPAGTPGTPADKGDRSGLLGRDTEPDPGIGGVNDTPPNVGSGLTKYVDPRPGLALLSALLLALLVALVRFEYRFRGLGTIDSAWGKTRLLGAYAGHAARPSQTPYEYAESMGQEIPDAHEPLRTIAHARVQDRYAPLGATDAERDAAAAAWRTIARVFVTLLPTRIVRAVAKLVR
ncbi:MAG TPA: transglutaminaseTgpA domain-containing protein [Candidatus Limnocylindria bacterium]|nr:transglutaminaseTgpA domain-containing protein [Candidatus Limnocylindria bacterium]